MPVAGVRPVGEVEIQELPSVVLFARGTASTTSLASSAWRSYRGVTHLFVESGSVNR